MLQNHQNPRLALLLHPNNNPKCISTTMDYLSNYALSANYLHPYKP